MLRPFLMIKRFFCRGLDIRVALEKFESILVDRWSMNPDENVLVDVSPSLGLLNRAILTTCDAFFMPAMPDLFSMYGVRNIGQTLLRWKKSYDSLYNAINPQLKYLFSEKFVQFLGFTIYNARVMKKSGEQLPHGKG